MEYTKLTNNKLKIGKIKIKNNLVLAPLAGITNLAFRMLCKNNGAGLVYSEMISANALAHGSKKTAKYLLKTDKKEKPVSFQIFGSDPKNIKLATEYINNINCDIIDINMGCPVRKVTSINSGAMLMKKLNKAQEVIKAVINNTNKPTTIKMRIGWNNNETYIDLARIAQDLGCAAITLHARTAEQMYSGIADINKIKELKTKIDIPLIGNGDIRTPQDAKKMLENTNCDGIMIGRYAMSDPTIFKRTDNYLKNNILEPEPTKIEKLKLILKYYDYSKKYGPVTAGNIKLHIFQILKGFKYSKQLKTKIGPIQNIDLLKQEIEQIINKSS
jgi:tRNA-dihydrouridine synthase B